VPIPDSASATTPHRIIETFFAHFRSLPEKSEIPDDARLAWQVANYDRRQYGNMALKCYR
jgi:hypothetical protein